PDLPPPDDKAWRWLPVFRTLLAPHGDRRESEPIVLSDSDETIELLAAALKPESYRAQGVFPYALAQLLRALWAIPQALVLLLGMVGPTAGYLAFGLFLLHLARFNLVGWLTQGYMLNALLVCCCLWLGYTLRLTLASQFQLQHPRRRQITTAHRNGCIGLAALIAILSFRADSLAITCGSLIAVISFYVADGY